VDKNLERGGHDLLQGMSPRESDGSCGQLENSL